MHPDTEREFDLYLLHGLEDALDIGLDDAPDCGPDGVPDAGGDGVPDGFARARFARLMADWRELLDLPSGAGLRLLRHLREQALPQQLLCSGPQIYAHAALADFLREREAEAAMAHPRKYLEFMTLAARAHARDAAETMRRR